MTVLPYQPEGRKQPSEFHPAFLVPVARPYGVFSSRVLPSGFVGGPTAVTVTVAFIVLGSLIDFYSEILNTFLICIGIFLCGFHGYYS